MKEVIETTETVFIYLMALYGLWTIVVFVHTLINYL